MRASETSFESYKSKPILFFAYLICSSVFETKTLKKTSLRFAIFNFSEKLQNFFKIGLKKYGVVVKKKMLLEKKYLEMKFADKFLLFNGETIYCSNVRANKQIPFVW